MKAVIRCYLVLWLVCGCHAGKDKTKKVKTSSPTVFPTVSPRPSPLASEDPTASPTITPQPTPLESEEPTMQPTTLSPTPLESEEPTMTPTTLAPTPLESEEPTMTPTTLAPTPLESEEPTMTPTTLAPTPVESEEPTMSPTSLAPTPTPSDEPTIAPTTLAPTMLPSDEPTIAPTTATPTGSPTISPRPTISPQPTATPTTLSPTVSAVPTAEPTMSRVAVDLGGLALEVSSEGPLDEGKVNEAVNQFLEEHLQVQYDTSFTSIKTETAISQDGGDDIAIVATRGTALFDATAGPAPTAESLEESVSDYIATGGDQVLEESLQSVGIAEVRSISLDGQVIPASAAPEEKPQISERSRRSGIRHPGAIAGVTVAGVVVCALLSLIAARFARGRGGGADSDEPEDNGAGGEAA